MKKIQFFGLFVLVAAAFGYVVYDMTKPNTVVAPSPATTESTPAPATEESRNEYKNELISFKYPYGYTAEENTDEAMVTLRAEKSDSLPLRIYSSTTSVESFGIFAEMIETDFELNFASGMNFEENTEFSYSFATSTQNGIPVLIHKRNFQTMSGTLNEAYIWLENGNLLTISTENPDLFDEVISSLKRP